MTPELGKIDDALFFQGIEALMASVMRAKDADGLFLMARVKDDFPRRVFDLIQESTGLQFATPRSLAAHPDKVEWAA